jgi:hypothetical protein
MGNSKPAKFYQISAIWLSPLGHNQKNRKPGPVKFHVWTKSTIRHGASLAAASGPAAVLQFPFKSS